MPDQPGFTPTPEQMAQMQAKADAARPVRERERAERIARGVPLPEGAKLPDGWGEDRRREAEQLWAAYMAETQGTGQLLDGGKLDAHLTASNLTGWVAATMAAVRRQEHLADAIEAERVRRAARRAVDAEEALEHRQPIMLVPASVVRKRQPPPELVDGLIPGPPCIGVFFGESGTYKSFLVLNLLLCVGSVSAAFLGHMVNATGLGIYVLGEGQGDAGLRVDAALGANLGFTDERLAYIEQAFPLSDEAAVDEVIARGREFAEATGQPVLLVVFDSFADFYGAGDNENSNTDMNRLIASMKKISAALGCVVMANAHTGHGGTDEEGNEKPPPMRLRGASRFRQAFDFELMATGGTLVPTKNRYGPKADPVRYSMRSQGGSLVLDAAGAGQEAQAGPEPWPYPCPFGAWVKVMDAISATPGMSMNEIQKVTRVRREHVSLALLKSEGPFITNTGTKNRPRWTWGGHFVSWYMEASADSASSLYRSRPYARLRAYRGAGTGNQFRVSLRESLGISGTTGSDLRIQGREPVVRA